MIKVKVNKEMQKNRDKDKINRNNKLKILKKRQKMLHNEYINVNRLDIHFYYLSELLYLNSRIVL